MASKLVLTSIRWKVLYWALVILAALLLAGLGGTGEARSASPKAAPHRPATATATAHAAAPVAAGPGAAPSTAPAACGLAWRIVPSPNLSSADNYLESLAALAANDVWAVGDYGATSAQQTLIEHWDGSSWSVVPSPNQGTGDNHLYGVAAVTAGDIWAVGTYWSGTAWQMLTEHWNGSSWSIVPSPNQGTTDNLLSRVAVRASNDVWAVGYYSGSGSNYLTLIEHWNGSSWSIVPSPSPSTSGNVLESGAAVAANDAWAVGGANNQPLTEHWNGTSWSVVSSPNPGTTGWFVGMATVGTATNDVWAVGNYTTNFIDGTLTEHWDGSSWSVVSSPNQGHSSDLRSVAAVAANDVWAVNHYVSVPSGIWQTLAEHWDGSAWSIVPSPNQGSSDNQLRAVAAVAAGDVWASGFSYNGTANRTLAEHYSDPCNGSTATPGPEVTDTPTSTPTATPTATPPLCGLDWRPVGGPGGALNKVAAISPSDIWATGASPLHWDGNSWSMVPSPAGAWDVAAVAPNDVWAVGGGPATTEHWDGTTWTLVPCPQPGIGSALGGVVAFSATNAWAVGQWIDSDGNYHSLVIHWDGTAWTQVTAPSPGPHAILNAISALSPTDIWAVGDYALTSAGYPVGGLVLHWDGTSWQFVASPEPEDPDAYSLFAVSARAANDVWAVGRGQVIPGMLTEHWDGQTWTLIWGPVQGGYETTLVDVVALADYDVWAVGYTTPFTGPTRTVLAHWNGGGWIGVAHPDISATGGLLGLAALSANDLWAVGYGPSNAPLLITHYNDPCTISTPTATATPQPTATSTAPPIPSPTPSPLPSGTATPDVPSPTPTGQPPSPTAPGPTATGLPASATPPVPTVTIAPASPTTAAPTATNVPASPTATPALTASSPVVVSPTRSATAIVSATPTGAPCALHFTDVHPTDYFDTPVLYLACHGVISGYGDGTFRAYSNTTRAQQVKIVVLGFALALQSPPAGEYTFTDVPPNQPFFLYIETAVADGIVSGYGCGGMGEPCDSNRRSYFRPNASVTRSQLAKIVAGAAGWNLINPGSASFADVAPGSAFYRFVETAACRGVISGYACGGPGEPCDPLRRPYFRQYSNATRGQIAKIVYGALTAGSSCTPPAMMR